MGYINKNFKYIFYGLILAAGIFIGWLAFGGGHSAYDHATEHAPEAQIWTCSMHPHIRQDHPGKCPICAMDLIPVKTAGAVSAAATDPDAVQLSEEAAALANIQTGVVARGNAVKELRLYGTIQPDERLLRSQVSHIGGRIERLVVNTAGESVRSGQVIAAVYSPDLLNAQQELLEAQKLGQPALLDAAREKLRQWKLTDSQIAAVERNGAAQSTVNITANVSGTVVAKRVEQGDYVSAGSVLFDVADLSAVWAVFDAYESDLPYLKVGDRVDYTLQSLPGKTFSGKVSFIDPMLDRATRTAKVRVETPNPRLELKPEMYANAVIQARLKQSGNELIIPKSAVLWTGKRSVVYVKQPDSAMPAFKLREVELGAGLSDSYVVLSGLREGEEVVTGGAFVIDASAQLEGKTSMMNNEATMSNYKNQNEMKKTLLAVSAAAMMTTATACGNHGSHHQESAPASTQAAAQNTHAMLQVQGACDMCKQRIEAAAKSVAGVSSAVWESGTKTLHLNFDPAKTSLNAISQAVAKAGHDTERDKATDKVYDALPGCCKYR